MYLWSCFITLLHIQCLYHQAAELLVIWGVVFTVVMGRDCLRGWAAKGPIVQLPDDTWMDTEHRCNDTDRARPKHSEKNLPGGHFVHHKLHMNWPGSKPEPLLSEAGDQPPGL
jgi:hypothetical protein